MKRARKTWVKMALIVAVLYFGGILVPLAAFVFSVQKDLILGSWQTGDVVLLAAAIALAAALSLGFWLKRLAERV